MQPVRGKPRKTYKLKEGSIHERFFQSRKKVRIMGGGFANGKTTALVILALQIAKDYPGSNMLLARSTYPKLNDTLKRVFVEWCPPDWIKSFPKTENVCTLKNGTTINFRYIAQKTQSDGQESTSNLLSATYDFVGVDQCEDPEIEYKDYLDLLGRLRGDTPYRGDDPTMPQSGPRWIVLTCNPTRNWVYKKLVQPIHWYMQGKKHPDLVTDADGSPLIDLIEGSTYENRENLAADYIELLESSYQGQMRERYLKGGWAAYEGLVYPQYSDDTHVLTYEEMHDHMCRLLELGYDLTPIEGYDYGMAVPSCYLGGFVDHRGNVMIMDGFYKAEYGLEDQANHIKKLRRQLEIPSTNHAYADPAIFRRSAPTVNAQQKGKSIAQIFAELGVTFKRGNNDITSGLTKVSMYLNPMQFHKHPINGNWLSPRIYFSDRLPFVGEEISDYYWKKTAEDEPSDKPRDKKDHACDTIKYILTDRPMLAKMKPKKSTIDFLSRPVWNERDVPERDMRTHRHG